MKNTIETIEKKLSRDGFVYRFSPRTGADRESTFVACSFWMMQNLMGAGRRSDGEKLFEKLIGRRNDVGLLSEEYDPASCGFRGNFPQALSHIALVNAARMLPAR